MIGHFMVDFFIKKVYNKNNELKRGCINGKTG